MNGDVSLRSNFERLQGCLAGSLDRAQYENPASCCCEPGYHTTGVVWGCDRQPACQPASSNMASPMQSDGTPGAASRPRPGGQIELILGPMFSGKTTELIRRVRRQQMAKSSCLLLSYKGDTRYSEEATAIVTHDQSEMKSIPVMRLEEVENAAWHVEVIAIDEGQFLPDLQHYAELWADHGKLVLIAALDSTYQRRPFENVMSLVPLSESVCKLSAVCIGCHQPAAFTFRKDSTSTALEDVGGSEKYQALCRSCHRAAVQSQLSERAAAATPRRSSRRNTRQSGLEPRLTSPSKSTRRQSLTSLSIR